MFTELQKKYDLYSILVKKHQDEHGFIDTKHCDSLLFSGLLGCVPNTTVNIKAAYDGKSKMWLRRPMSYPECLQCGGSVSTISRDMMLGLAWYVWKNNRLDIAEQVVKYALSNWCIMGKAATFKDLIGRCLMTPGLLATWAEISYRLGGPNRWWLRYLPQFESSSVMGYEAHLCVLHILLRKELTGTIPKRIEKVLHIHATKNPTNPLFQYAVGKIDDAVSLLMVDTWWPNDRLPTRGDRKESWLIQRNYGDDWKPAKEEKEIEHSGADFLFVSSLILKNK
jgi:hypothetical protein